MSSGTTYPRVLRRKRHGVPLLALSLTVFVAASLLAPSADALSIGGFKNAMVTFLLEKISVPGQFEVIADEVQSPSNGVSVLKGLRISDGRGVWFRAEQFSFTWSPSKLLLGEVQIDAITLERAQLDRLPQVEGGQPESPQPASPFAWPRSPIAVNIPKIAITALRVSEAILPQAVTFDAAGTLRDEGDEQSLTLSVKRVDTVAGSIDFSYLKRFDDDRLTLKLLANEAPGGLVAKAAALPADVAAMLDINGSGTPAQWNGRLELNVDGMLAAQGTLDAHWLQRIGVNLTGTLTPGMRLAQAPRLAIGEQADFELVLQEDDNGVVLVKQARIQAQALKLAATGTFERQSSLLDLAVDVTVDRDGAQRLSPLIRPLAFEQATLRVTAKGSADAPLIAGRGDLLAPSAEGFAARSAELVFDVPTTDGSTATLTVIAASPSGPDPAYSKVFGPRVSIELVTRREGETIAIDKADIASAALQVTTSGQVKMATPVELDLAMDVSVDRDGARHLSPLIEPLAFEQASLRLVAKGPADAPLIAGSGELLAPSAEGFAARSAELVFDVPTADGSTATLKVIAASPSGPNPAYSKAFGPRVSIELVTRRTGETIAIDKADLASTALQATASGQVKMATPIELDLAYTLTVPDLVPLAAAADIAASGALRADGSASGAVSALTTTGNVRLSRAVFNGQRLGQIDVAHDTRIDEQIAGTARLKMDSADFGRGSASGAFRVQGQSVAINRLQLDLLGVKASGSLNKPAGVNFPAGALDFTVTSLQPLARLTGRQLSGRGNGRAQFAADAGGESTLQAEFNALRIEALTLQRLRVDGKASDLAGALPSLSLRVDAQEFSDAGDTRLDNVSLRAEGSLAALAVNIELAGTHREHPLSATSSALAALDKPDRQLRIDTLQASYAGELMQLLQPTHINVSASSVQVEDLDLSLPDEGRVRGWFKQLPAASSVDLQLAKVPLRLLKVLAAAPIGGGTLSGQISGDTARDAPTLDARLSVTELRLDNVPADTGSLAAELIALWDGRDLSADLSISGPFEPNIKGRFRVPMSLAASGTAAGTNKTATGAQPATTSSFPVLDFESAIDAQLDWRGEVEPVMALLPIPDHVLSGVATIAVRVVGSLNAPLPSGELTLKNGRYENLVAGTIIEDISLSSDFSDQQRVRFSLDGNDGEQGLLQVKGVVLPGSANELLDISARVERMLVVRVDAATVLSSADLSVKSSAEALDVKGNVVVEHAEIRLLNPLPPSIVDLGEVRIQGQPIVTDTAGDGEPVVPVRLDIGVDIPARAFVRGRGLDSEWGGALRISGTASQPQVDGQIESRRGVLELIGRAFDLQRGRIVFAGKSEINPNLDLRLVREANDITGTIIIEGTGSRPSLRLTSNPALPADEVLPRLLFGRSKQSLSGPEAVQLAAGLAALVRGDESVLDTARKALGVDVLRIESAKEGSDSVGDLSVGRYATENIYVGAKQALDGQSSSVVVEIKLPRNFVVDSEVGQGADSSVGITWRRDF